MMSLSIECSKMSLKLAIARIKLLKNKREVLLKQMKRDLAKLLESGQEQSARIRVSFSIRPCEFDICIFFWCVCFGYANFCNFSVNTRS